VSEATDKMRAEGLPDIAISTFEHYERLLGEGDEGTLPEPSSSRSRRSGGGRPARPEPGALERAVVLKLNGGLGTSMGMTEGEVARSR
jgi:UTP--glucose-1-phosphate uridylyltransferase